eukprot:CAMPEP_0185564168 /NCGR_PEP_ID=MMETSP1381-20130426/64970_1 /TAXON_ID=298111 /ORGANISM="Pavlova sp., Strain CCMP459" /LENGTH=167 /DNA_ID=CAMNT_0028178101 /DNA_START=697 /DNA_END=1195 /DNA_ORIENTATION=+
MQLGMQGARGNAAPPPPSPPVHHQLLQAAGAVGTTASVGRPRARRGGHRGTPLPGSRHGGAGRSPPAGSYGADNVCSGERIRRARGLRGAWRLLRLQGRRAVPQGRVWLLYHRATRRGLASGVGGALSFRCNLGVTQALTTSEQVWRMRGAPPACLSITQLTGLRLG